MPLTNEEFARLDAARLNSKHLRVNGSKRILQIAFEHIEDLQGQQKRALSLIDQLVAFRNESLCWRIPAFFAVQWAKVKSWFR
ncbi:MAG: hypothetical protein LLG14_27380 [Nocardiaceae bacterium]|nr:hypothetical protein [Nocardiaceae bacterium]